MADVSRDPSMGVPVRPSDASAASGWMRWSEIALAGGAWESCDLMVRARSESVVRMGAVSGMVWSVLMRSGVVSEV